MRMNFFKFIRLSHIIANNNFDFVKRLFLESKLIVRLQNFISNDTLLLETLVLIISHSGMIFQIPKL